MEKCLKKWPRTSWQLFFLLKNLKKTQNHCIFGWRLTESKQWLLGVCSPFFLGLWFIYWKHEAALQWKVHCLLNVNYTHGCLLMAGPAWSHTCVWWFLSSILSVCAPSQFGHSIVYHRLQNRRRSSFSVVITHNNTCCWDAVQEVYEGWTNTVRLHLRAGPKQMVNLVITLHLVPAEAWVCVESGLTE